MTAYYNDNDRHVAAWLKELIKAGMISQGDVDERSIKDVTGADLKGYTRVHFFAGIGGWDYALQLAGWPSDRYVWTGSCPCQPLSGAGQRKGERDERHLWPEFHRLIKECHPSTVFGEQVASADGREWFAGVRADLEALEYAVGGADLCAAGEAAPHIRQRLYWLAESQSSFTGQFANSNTGREREISQANRFRLWVEPSGCSQDGGLADSERGKTNAPSEGGFLPGTSNGGTDSRLADSKIAKRGRASGKDDGGRRLEEAGRYGITSGVGNALDDGCPDGCTETGGTQRQGEQGRVFQSKGTGSGMGNAIGERREGNRPELSQRGDKQQPAEPGSGYWTNSILIPCGDGKARRIEPGISPLVDGLSGRVVIHRTIKQTISEIQETEKHTYSRIGALRGFGNAIVPQVAAKFVRVYLEITN